MQRSLRTAAVVLIGLLALAGASAQAGPLTVALKVRITGLGAVRVSGGDSYTCHSYPCVHTFQVPRGQRILIRAVATKGWKLTQWTGVCRGSTVTCSYRATGWRIVALTFVPPGDWRNPIPLGRAVKLAGGWRVKVNSAKINATSEVEGVVDSGTGNPANGPPATGFQYTLVNVSLTYLGGGGFPGNSVDSFLYGLSELGVKGQASGLYPPDSCQPPRPDADSGGNLSTGQTVTGNLCYEISSAAASTLRMLGVASSLVRPQYLVWFALR